MTHSPYPTSHASSTPLYGGIQELPGEQQHQYVQQGKDGGMFFSGIFSYSYHAIP